MLSNANNSDQISLTKSETKIHFKSFLKIYLCMDLPKSNDLPQMTFKNISQPQLTFNSKKAS